MQNDRGMEGEEREREREKHENACWSKNGIISTFEYFHENIGKYEKFLIRSLFEDIEILSNAYKKLFYIYILYIYIYIYKRKKK